MEFQILCSQRQQSRKIITTSSYLVLYGLLAVLIGCSKPATNLPQGARTAFGNYLTKSDFKAFAVDLKTGAYGWNSGYRRPSWAVEDAIKRCEKYGVTCQLFAVGNRKVVDMTDEQVSKVKEEYFSRIITDPKIDERGKFLSSEEIKKYLSGRTLKGKTNIGDKLIVTVFSNGQISARAVDKGVEDSGIWYVKDDKFCRKFRKFSLGRLDCQKIMKDGNTFRFYSEGRYVSEFSIFSFK